MENETLFLHVWLSPSSLPRCLSFSDIIAFLSVFVTLSLANLPIPHPHTATYKQRVITNLQGAITSVIQGFYMVAWS